MTVILEALGAMVVPYYRALQQQGPHAFFCHRPAEEDKELEVAERMTRNHPRCLTDKFVFQVKNELEVYRDLNASLANLCDETSLMLPLPSHPLTLLNHALPGPFPPGAF
jgi:hypothetical protein